MIDSTLMQQFKFTEADLQANRRGVLSDGQQARWSEAGQWSGSVMTTAVPLITAALIAITGIAASLALSQPIIGVMISLVVAIVVGGVLRMQVRKNGRNQTPAPATAVAHAEGIAHLKEKLDSSEHGLSRRYRLDIEHHSFQLFRKEQFEALENGARYTVYYLDDNDKYIVSLEKS